VLIGIDVLDVSQRFSLADIANVNIENLPLEPYFSRLKRRYSRAHG